MAKKTTTKTKTKTTKARRTDDTSRFRVVWVSKEHKPVALAVGDEVLFVKATKTGLQTVKTEKSVTGSGKLRTVAVAPTLESGKQLLLAYEPGGPYTRPVQAVYNVDESGKLHIVEDTDNMPKRIAAMLPKAS